MPGVVFGSKINGRVDSSVIGLLEGIFFEQSIAVKLEAVKKMLFYIYKYIYIHQ